MRSAATHAHWRPRAAATPTQLLGTPELLPPTIEAHRPPRRRCRRFPDRAAIQDTPRERGTRERRARRRVEADLAVSPAGQGFEAATTSVEYDHLRSLVCRGHGRGGGCLARDSAPPLILPTPDGSPSTTAIEPIEPKTPALGNPHRLGGRRTASWRIMGSVPLSVSKLALPCRAPRHVLAEAFRGDASANAELEAAPLQWLSRGTPFVCAMRWYSTAGLSTMPFASSSTRLRWISCHGVWLSGTM